MAMPNATIQSIQFGSNLNVYQAANTILAYYGDPTWALGYLGVHTVTNSTMVFDETAGVIAVNVGTPTQMNAGTGTEIATISLANGTVKGEQDVAVLGDASYEGYRIPAGSVVYLTVKTKPVDSCSTDTVCNVDAYLRVFLEANQYISK